MPEGERSTAQYSVEPAQRALMKEREQRPHRSEHRNEFVQLMFKNQERWKPPQLPVAKQERDVFEAQYQQVARNAKRDLSQHRVRIRMPKGEPCPQWLSDIDHQNGNRSAVTDEAHDYSCVEDRFQLSLLQDIDQKSREECSRSERNNPEV